MTDKPQQRQRRADTVTRIIRETPGLNATQIGRRMGNTSSDPGRYARTYIGLARDAGEPITIGLDGGYVYLGEDGVDDETRAELIRHHRARTRDYMHAHARLLQQIGRMTASEVAQMALFEILVPQQDDDDGERPESMSDLARLPVERRAGLFQLFRRYLDAMESDPEAFASERAVIADQYGKVFITKGEADKLAQAKRLLEEVGI